MQLQQTILRDQTASFELPLGKMSFFDNFYVDYQFQDTGTYQRYQLTIHPKEDFVLQELKLVFSQTMQPSDSVFCNGFQSASESRIFNFQEQKNWRDRLTQWLRPTEESIYLKALQPAKAQLQSWTYAYLPQGKQVQFIGSLQEQTGFTLIEFDPTQNQIVVRKDCAGLQLSHSFKILDLLVFKGKQEAAFQQFFSLQEIQPLPERSWIGWTSSSHSPNHTAAYLLKNLEALQKRELTLDFVQFSYGYQQAIGDWLDIQDKFPDGLSPLVSNIQAIGSKASICFAPFVCEAKSKLFQQRKTWLLKDDQGNFVTITQPSLSPEKLYVLDFYQEDFQQHLTGICYTFLSKWGFECLHFDLLYAVCLHPRPNKTRGQIMSEAVKFLQAQVGEQLSWADAVPLGACFGKVDFCNLGGRQLAHWSINWREKLLSPSADHTLITLRNYFSRWAIGNKAFLSATPPLSLIDHQNPILSQQQTTLLTIQCLLSPLWHLDDDLSGYSVEQWAEFEGALQWRNAKVEKIAIIAADIYTIAFKKENQTYLAVCNLNPTAKQVNLKSLQLDLEACESLILQIK
ncbi:MAG: alpha-galactosidase [Saprospiraceae bacterium]